MDQSWFSSTIGYVYKTVSGDDTESEVTSRYRKVFPNGMCVKDLPTNNYEPLEATYGRQATSQKNTRKELEEKIAAIKAECVVKSKKITTLKERIAELETNDLTKTSHYDKKMEDTLQLLKKAKRAALVAKGNLIKKTYEFNLTKEKEDELEKVIVSLKEEILHLRETMGNTRKSFLGELEEVKGHLTTRNTELFTMKEKEDELEKVIVSLKEEILHLRETMGNMRNSFLSELEEVKGHLSTRNTVLFTMKEQMENATNSHVNEMEEVKRQLSARNTELLALKEREMMLTESNNSMKQEITEIREMLKNLSENVIGGGNLMNHRADVEITHDVIASNAELVPNSKRKENELKRVDSLFRQGAQELQEKLEQSRKVITGNQETITKQKEQMDNLINSSNEMLFTSKGKWYPSSPLPLPDSATKGSGDIVPLSSPFMNQVDQHKTIEPWNPNCDSPKANGHLNSRPINKSMDNRPLMTSLPNGNVCNTNGPWYDPMKANGHLNSREIVSESIHNKPRITSLPWNPRVNHSMKAKGYLNNRPLPSCSTVPESNHTLYPARNVLKDEEGFFTKTFNKWFGFS